MARERYKEPSGLDAGVDDGVDEVPFDTMRPVLDHQGLLPDGYTTNTFDTAGFKTSSEDVDRGYCSYGMLDLNDMFCAFDQRQMGVVGGDKTVDDFTPEGLDWHTGDVGVGDEIGGGGRGSGRAEGSRSSAPGRAPDSLAHSKSRTYGPNQGGRSPESLDIEDYDDDDEVSYSKKGQRAPLANLKRYP